MGFLIFLIVSSQTGYTAREYQPSPAEIRVTEFAYKTRNTDSLIAFMKDALVSDSLNVKLHRSYQDTRLGAEKDRTGLLREYEKLLTRHPQSPVFLYLFGRIQLDSAKEKEYFDRAYNADSNNFWANYGLGAHILNRGKNFEQAKRFLDRAVAIDNSIYLPFQLYANYYAEIEDYQNEEKFLALALTCEPTNYGFLQQICFNAYKTPNYDISIGLAKTFLTHKEEVSSSEIVMAYYRLKELYLKKKDFDTVQAYIDTIKSLQPKATFYDDYAKIYAYKNRPDSVLFYLKQYAKKETPVWTYNLIKSLKFTAPDVMKDKKLVQYFNEIKKELGLDLRAKEIEGKTSDGKEISLKQFKGKTVLVDFWASWCGPCRGETPFLIGVYNKYHAQGLEIIGVNIDNNREAMDGYLKDNPGMVWPQVYSGKAWKDENAVRYGVKAIPQIVLVDKKGILREISLRGEGIEKAVSKYLE